MCDRSFGGLRARFVGPPFTLYSNGAVTQIRLVPVICGRVTLRGVRNRFTLLSRDPFMRHR